MSQRNIENYFTKSATARPILSDTSDSTDSSDIDDGDINNYISPSADIFYYEELFKRKNEIKKISKVVVNTSAISECWKHFGDLYIKERHILEKFKFCKLCFENESMVLKSFAKSTSTTNYNSHLWIVHNLDVKTVNQKKKFATTQNALETSSSKNNKYQNARRIAEMCCWDLQPFKIVERAGFQKFVKYLNPKAILPTDRNIATSALKDVYDVYMDIVKKVISNSPKNVAIVLDMWSDKYKHLSYINLKIHFCQDFEMKVITLKTEIFPRPHTAVAVAKKIDEALIEFDLQDKDICAVTDGGSNIVSALKTKNITRFGCSAHALHRFLMHDVLNNHRFSHINDIIKKLKQIFRSLMYSSEEIRKLQNLEEQDKLIKIILETQEIIESMECEDGFPSGDYDFSEVDKSFNIDHQPSLKNSVPTRWNSLLTMINSFVKNISIINIALLRVNKDPLLIPDMEKEIIKEFGIFLQTFEQATKYLQGQQYPTISYCIYFLESVLSGLEKAESESCFELSIQLCNFAKTNFPSRFKIYKMHVVAALMDPCQKSWPILNKYLKKIPHSASNSYELNHDVKYSITKEKLILEEVKKVLGFDENQPSTSQQAPDHLRKKQKISNTRQQMLDFMATTSSPSSAVEDPLEREINKYFETQVDETETIDWWQQHKETFPNISKLADICFGIPATSASSETAFSVAGNCVYEKRSRLNPTTIKMQLFVHDNKNIVEPYLN